jgi:hypothetical protein
MMMMMLMMCAGMGACSTAFESNIAGAWKQAHVNLCGVKQCLVVRQRLLLAWFT